MFCHRSSGEEACSRLKEDDASTPHEIALARCNCLMDRYLRWKLRDHCYSNVAQGVALIFTAITPVLLLMPDLFDLGVPRMLGAAASAIAAIATGLLAFTGWREDYIRYGYTFHSLQTEKYRYLTRATEEYQDCKDDEEKAARLFAKRIEDLVMAEVIDWRAEMKRVEQQGLGNSRAGASQPVQGDSGPETDPRSGQ